MRCARLGSTLAILLTACGAAAPRTEAPERPRIVDGRTGRPVDLDVLVDAMRRARVIYVGEEHDRPEDHAAQLAILRALHASEPRLAIGLEMVQHPFQAPLDAYVERAIDERELLERIEWEERWGFDFALYQPIFAYAREASIPLVALNARRELTRAIARGEPLDDRSAEMPEIDRSDEAHRAMFADAMREHPGLGPDAFERFYTAQLVWDETMATHVARALEHVPRIVVFAGVMHVRGGLGIPRRAARRGADPFLVILPASAADARPEDPPIADYFWVTDP